MNSSSFLRQRNLLLYLLLLLSFGCIPRLKEKEKSAIPYSGYETLIFVSNKSERDTIYLDGYEDEIVRYLKAHRHILKFDREKRTGKKSDFITNIFIAAEANPKSRSLMIWTMWYPKLFSHTIEFDSLQNIKESNFVLKNYRISDVVKLQNENKTLNQSDSINPPIQYIYWSKSLGIVGYDITDSLFWRLDSIKK